jgi:hypothetical protein
MIAGRRTSLEEIKPYLQSTLLFLKKRTYQKSH